MTSPYRAAGREVTDADRNPAPPRPHRPYRLTAGGKPIGEVAVTRDLALSYLYCKPGERPDESLIPEPFDPGNHIAVGMIRLAQLARTRGHDGAVHYRMCNAAVVAVEAALSGGPHKPTAEQVKLWHPHPPPGLAMCFRGVAVQPDPTVPWIDLELGAWHP